MSQSTKQINIEVRPQVVLQYDESSPEFQEALASYNEMIANGDAEDLLRYVACNLVHQGGHHEMIEGVGYVPLIGTSLTGNNAPWSGIRVELGYDMIESEVS
jgi:hypothetical protein